MIPKEIANKLVSHLNFRKSIVAKRTSLEEDMRTALVKIDRKNIFTDFEEFIQSDLEVVSLQRYFRNKCFETMTQNTLLMCIKKTCDTDEPINTLMRTFYSNIAKLSTDDFFEFLTKVCEITGGSSNHLYRFVHRMATVLSNLKRTSFYLWNKPQPIEGDSSKLPPLYLLFETLIGFVHTFTFQMVNISIFISIPDVKFYLFTYNEQYNNTQSELTSICLAVSSDFAILVDDRELCILLTVFCPTCTLKSFQKMTRYIPLDDVSETRYNRLLKEFKPYNGLWRESNSCGFDVISTGLPQYVIPIQFNQDTSSLSISHFLTGIMNTIFTHVNLPGIIQEEQGDVLLSNECIPGQTSWYEICSYYLSPLLTKNTVSRGQVDRLNRTHYHRNFLQTAGSYFISDKEIIEQIWMKPAFWNVVPFAPTFFVLSVPLDTYRFQIPHLGGEKTEDVIVLDRDLKVASWQEHRTLSKTTYVLLLLSQVDAPVRSLLLLNNMAQSNVCKTFFPFFNSDNSDCKITPLSLRFVNIDTQIEFLKSKLHVHAVQGKEIVKTRCEILFGR